MKNIGRFILVVLGLFVLIQIIPYGRNHTNPPVVSEPAWDSPQTKALAARACLDCHSNDTTWPWYSNLAPISWLVQHDVDEGRQSLNLSEWGQRRYETDEIYGLINNGEMPPSQFLFLHPQARLTESEKQALIKGFRATLGQSEGMQ
jgi:mono/diheme cytochrome c family protein